MKRLSHHSQYFLRNPGLVKELVQRSALRPRDTVIDIGAGSGVISSVLSRVVKKVIAVEFEGRAAEKLRENMYLYPNVEVVHGDFLEMPLPTSQYAIFANIPFHLSSPIIQRLIDTPTPPRLAYFIVQKQFGKKLTSYEATHFTSQLGMLAGIRYNIRILRSLQKTDFWPHPNVDTVFLEMKRREEPLIPEKRMKAYTTFTIECFSSPKHYLKLPLETVGISRETSPSRLTLEKWVALFNAQKQY